MSPETKNQLLVTVDELKRVISQCMDEDHESKGVIAQIERTIASIEQKTSLPRSIDGGIANSNSFPSFA